MAVAHSLKAELRSYDLTMRYGGDEFVCVLPGLTREDAHTRLTLVNTTLGHEVPGESVSFGVAQLLPDDTASDVVGRADAALYTERSAARGE